MPYVLKSKIVCGRVMYYRPESSDETTIDEVVLRRIYRKPSIEFDVEAGERWLDLGANIGSFAIYCHTKGASGVDCFEPEKGCFSILKKNLEGLGALYGAMMCAITSSKDLEVTFYLNDNIRGRYSPKHVYSRGTTHKFEAREINTTTRTVKNASLNSIITRYHGIKMDIEGSEFGILDSEMIPQTCRKLVMEYHTSKDKDTKNLARRLAYLKREFDVVHYPPEFDRMIEEGGLRRAFFDRMIFCKR